MNKSHNARTDARPLRNSLPYVPNSATSEAAASAARAGAPKMRERVAAYVLGTGYEGATRDEIADALFKPINSVTPRVTELLSVGILVRSGATRPTKWGRLAEVLVHRECASASADAPLEPIARDSRPGGAS